MTANKRAACGSTDLLLLQGLDERVLQPVGVLGLQGLLLIGRHAQLTEDAPALLLLPVGGEVRLALGAQKWVCGSRRAAELSCPPDNTT